MPGIETQSIWDDIGLGGEDFLSAPISYDWLDNLDFENYFTFDDQFGDYTGVDWNNIFTEDADPFGWDIGDYFKDFSFDNYITGDGSVDFEGLMDAAFTPNFDLFTDVGSGTMGNTWFTDAMATIWPDTSSIGIEDWQTALETAADTGGSLVNVIGSLLGKVGGEDYDKSFASAILGGLGGSGGTSGGIRDLISRLLGGGSGSQDGNLLNGMLGLGGLLAGIFGDKDPGNIVKTYNYPDWVTNAMKTGISKFADYPFNPDPYTGGYGYNLSPYDYMAGDMLGYLGIPPEYAAMPGFLADNYLNPYGGPTSVGMSPYWQDAINAAMGRQDPYSGNLTVNWNKYYNKSYDTAKRLMDQSLGDLYDFTQGNKTIEETDLGMYMNPYVDAVLDPQIERMTDRYAQDFQDISTRAAQVNAFGDERDLLMKQQLKESYDKGTNEATANAWDQAFKTALDSAKYDTGNRLKTLQGMPGGYNILNSAYMGLGDADINVQTKNIELMYDEFLRRMEAGEDVSGLLSQIAAAEDALSQWNTTNMYNVWNDSMGRYMDYGNYMNTWGPNMFNMQNDIINAYTNMGGIWRDQDKAYNSDFMDMYKWMQEFPLNAYSKYGAGMSPFFPSNIDYMQITNPAEDNQWAQLLNALAASSNVENSWWQQIANWFGGGDTNEDENTGTTGSNQAGGSGITLDDIISWWS